jgi:23S rRNA (uracil1939-C5)-methyltransferase
VSLSTGQELELTIDKPAAGGRMIARHEGQIVLVLGAIPGERVLARVERADKRLAFATSLRAVDPSDDRRDVAGDPLCGGCLYSHIAYGRQVALKGEVIADAFSRIGRIPLTAPVAVEPSTDHGYRMRARLHVTGGRAGFFREGTHQLCDPAPTGQLRAETLSAVTAALAALSAAQGPTVMAVEITENIAGDQRAIHFDLAPGETVSGHQLAAVVAAAGVIGCTARTADGVLVSAGDARVSDSVPVLTGGRARDGVLQRSPESFFQANRYLLPHLVMSVLDSVGTDGTVLDLYAGVGLFSVALAATGRAEITAVEGDRASGADLRRNAAAYPDAIRFVIGRVEDHLARRGDAPAAIIVDPPRTGISRDAMDGVIRHGAQRLVYVSCDPPTLARDARRLLDAGYRLGPLKGFDLFPNTPHVEVLAVFDRPDAE